MLKILNGFFVVMGVIFSILILGAVAILLLTGMNPVSTFKAVTGNNATKVDNVDKNPLLTEEQEAQLESLGINPASLPSEITPEMEACFTQKLGVERTNQIKQGDKPTVTDYFKASSCF